MRIARLSLFVAGLLLAEGSWAQGKNSAATPEDSLQGCPGAVAFAKQEKARQLAATPQVQVTPTRPKLASELRQWVARDQAARTTFFSHQNPSTFAQLAAVDAVNLKKLKHLIATVGFPTIAMVGREGLQDAWLMTQHADRDVPFQKQVLAILEARHDDSVRLDDLAMLEDRIRVNEGRPQRYGGNYDLKTLRPTPIEDPEHVDERRAKMHLMPMADYQCVMEHMYPKPNAPGSTR